MCVIAGYVGANPAAPILIEMLRKEQGLGGGYYTGIATIHDGRLHWAKALGDLDTLLAETDAAQLPGSVGIAHGRSKSGGEREWAHPFVDDRRKLAYVANGAMGFFEGKTDYGAAGSALLERGHRFLSANEEAIGGYPVLSDGMCVHVSEVMCHQIAEELAESEDLAGAMMAAFTRLPAEIVGLGLSVDAPDRISAARLNMPLVVGRDDSGMHAATTALAFPASVEWTTPVAPNTAATILPDRVELRPFADPPAPVAPIVLSGDLRAIVLMALRDGAALGLGALCEASSEMWPEDALPQKGMAVFEVLVALEGEGAIVLEDVRAPGQYDRGTVPETRVRRVV